MFARLPLLFGLLFGCCLNSSIPTLACAHDPAEEMAAAAQLLLQSLDESQVEQIQSPFEDPLRKDWQFVPMDRQGLGLKQMKVHQRGLALSLVQTALSHRGFANTMQIMALEQVLFEMENGNLTRDPAKYHIFLFGQPSTESTWGWRVEGHHLSLSATVVGGKQVQLAPTFWGTNPAEVRQGAMKGLRVLGDLEDQARGLLLSLDDSQRGIALLSGKVPKDILNGPGTPAQALDPKGVSADQLNGDQRQALKKLVEAYLGRFRQSLAEQDLKRIEKAGLEKLHFAWIGDSEKGKPHYFRVQGPTFVMEYDNTQNRANHVHVVWRDMTNDFGGHTLEQHYRQHHAEGEK